MFDAYAIYLVGLATLPLLWLLWNVLAVVAFTLRDTWVIVTYPQKTFSKTLLLVALTPIVFGARLWDQAVARYYGYSVTVR